MAQFGNTGKTIIADNLTYELEVFCAFGSQLSVNRIRYVSKNAVGILVTYSDALAAFAAFIPDLWKNLMSVQASYLGLGIREVGSNRGPQPGYDDTGNGVGAVAGDILPTAVSGLLGFTTRLTGPSNRGRIFVPFPSEASNGAGGAPTAGYLADLNTMGAALMPAVNVVNGGSSVDLLPCIMHPGPAFDTTLITGFVARSQWASCRHRSARSPGGIAPF